jgi:hypothetical protein
MNTQRLNLLAWIGLAVGGVMGDLVAAGVFVFAQGEGTILSSRRYGSRRQRPIICSRKHSLGDGKSSGVVRLFLVDDLDLLPLCLCTCEAIGISR